MYAWKCVEYSTVSERYFLRVLLFFVEFAGIAFCFAYLYYVFVDLCVLHPDKRKNCFG